MPETSPVGQASDEPRSQLAILRALALGAGRLLAEPHEEGAIEDVLALLGEAASVSRVYVIQTRRGPFGRMRGSLTHEWDSPAVEPRRADPEWKDYPYDTPDAARWQENLARGLPIVGHVRDFPEAERAVLDPLGVRSLVAVPMMMGDEWVGHVGFDECAREREWSDAEVDALTAGAAILGAALARRRDDARVRAAEERFRTVVEQLPAVTHISGLDPTSSTIYISPRVQQLLGYAPEDWLEDPDLWVKVLHPNDRERMIAENIDHIHTGRSGGSEYRMIARDGRIVWVFEDVTLMRDPDGTPLYSQGVWLDITERKKAEDALREAEARYRTLVEQIPVVTYTDIIGDEDRFTYISPQVESLLGYTPEEWLADPELWTSVVHPDDIEAVAAEDERCNRTGEPYAADYRFVARDGHVVWVHDEAVPIPSRRGEPQVWQGVIVNVTERRKAEEAIRFQAQLLETVRDAVTAVDDRGAITYWNRFAETLYGRSAEEVMGQDIRRILLSSADPAVANEVSRMLSEGREWTGEFNVERPDGSNLIARASLSPIRDSDGEVTGSIAVGMDVTERRRAEEALRLAFERERDISQQLRAVDEIKNTFLQAVSHELRTPLSAILGFALTLEREEVALTPDESREIIHRLAANASKLERLLIDLLDLDRLGRGVLEPKRRDTDAAGLIRHVVEGMELSDDRPISVEAEPVTVSIDPAKVERIVENLVSNALRHTPPGTKVWISADRAHGGLLLRVDDAGPGIPEDMREAIFEPFRQAPTVRPHSPGVGIGLTLVARFAELHGGRAWVEPREGGGSSFRVFLPEDDTDRAGGRPARWFDSTDA